MPTSNKIKSTLTAGCITFVLTALFRGLDLCLHGSSWLTLSVFLYALIVSLLAMAMVWFPTGNFGEKLFQTSGTPSKGLLLRRALFVGAFITFGFFSVTTIVQFYRGIALNVTHYLFQALILGLLFGVVFYYNGLLKR